MDGAFMPMSRPARVFESSLLHGSSHKTSGVDALITENLNLIAHEFNKMRTDSPPAPPPGPLVSDESATLLRELGDYFTRTAQMWSTMTHNLLQGPHIDSISADVNQRSLSQTGLADLSVLTAVDVEIGRLRKIRDLTAKFSQDVQAVWQPDGVAASSPNQSIRGNRLPLTQPLSSTLSQGAHLVSANRHAHSNLAGGLAEQMTLGNDDGSDSETDDEELFAHIDMDALKQRGKGDYHCPKGFKCDKGGVDKAGNLVKFDRNSSFAQHCNKHRKPWVCELDHCPNTPKKRRFARRDGLERHKQTVKHEPKHADLHASVR